MGDETNSSVCFGREGARIPSGKKTDRRQKWSNAVPKRRADGGREGGALKYSNISRENDPVYAPMFGGDEPFHHKDLPGNGESERTPVIFLPDKFCDGEELRAAPTSPRGFHEADIDVRIRIP